MLHSADKHYGQTLMSGRRSPEAGNVPNRYPDQYHSSPWFAYLNRISDRLVLARGFKNPIHTTTFGDLQYTFNLVVVN